MAGPFRLGACRVDPDLNLISGPGGETLMEPKAIAVLTYLAEYPGRVISAQELIRTIWLGRPMGDNPVYRCISQLRHALGDDPRQPRYIATVPTKGYRLIAAIECVSPAPSLPHPGNEHEKTRPPQTSTRMPAPARWPAIGMGAVLLALLLIGYWIWRTDDPSAQPPPVVPTLAVLPFESLPPTVENDLLADGISEAVLNRLAALDTLRVVARTSSFFFKRSGYEAPRIAGLLEVEYILQGELQREGDRLRVGVELVDRDGFQVWSGTFTQVTGHEDFSLQDAIADAVVKKLAPQLLPLPVGVMQPSFEAFQHYLIGHELMIRRPEGFARSAREQFDLAILIEPEFAEAYAERAISSLFEPEPVQPGQFKALLDAAWRDIDKALELNPDTALAHAARGLLLQLNEPRGNAAAEASLRRALAMDPYLVSAWNWLANVLEAQGRIDESDEALRIAARIDPLAPSIGANLARHEAARGQFEAAEDRLHRLMTVPQPASLVAATLIDLYLGLGRLPEALSVARERALRSVDGDAAVSSLADLAWIHAMLGDWERADYWRGRAERAIGDEAKSRFYWTLFELHFGHPGYAPSVSEFEDRLIAGDMELGGQPVELQAEFGALLSLAGESERAISTLEPLHNIAQPSPVFGNDEEVSLQHALAWAWLQSSHSSKANTLLNELQEIFRRHHDDGRLQLSVRLIGYARNQLLLNETERALDLLEQAERAGWRDYYHVARDPRWDAVREEPRFQAVMARVKSAIDTQRARIEDLAPEDEFIERLDAAIRSDVPTSDDTRHD